MDLLPATEHECAWKAEALALRAELAELKPLVAQAVAQAAQAAEQAEKVPELEHQLDILKKQVFGPRSERRPPPYKAPTPKADPEKTQQTRRENMALRDDLPTEDVPHAVPPQACACDKCGGVAERLLPAKVTDEIVFVAAKFRRRRHILQVKACRCGEFVTQAPGPARVQDKSPYHASVYAAIAPPDAAIRCRSIGWPRCSSVRA
jgi:hypothetical protein